MKKNLGRLDRAARLLGALAMMVSAFMAPVPLVVQIALGASAIYVLVTAFAGTCLGYRLMGLSTCPVADR